MGGSGRLGMLHWNIHSWRDDRKRPNHQAVEELIGKTRADVVSLTEVSTPWGDSRPLREIAERVGYQWVFVPALEYRGSAATQGYGNALLTRLPVRGMQQWRVHAPERYAGTEPSEPRTVALAQVDVGGTPVWVGSTHLPASDEGDRAVALRRLAGLLRGLEAPWLVCGDFNTPARTWREDLPEGVTVAAPRWRRATFPARNPVRAIDYGLASPSLRTRGRVLRSDGSDHRAICVSAGWGGTPPARPPRA